MILTNIGFFIIGFFVGMGFIFLFANITYYKEIGERENDA